MAIYQAKVFVNLRPSVLDPAGEASKAAAIRLGVDGVKKIRIGKFITVQIEACDPIEATKNVELLSDRLLANPVIENWNIELEEITQDDDIKS